LQHFWDAQPSAFKTAAAQQKLRPKTSVNIPFFSVDLQHIHGFALNKVLLEYTKLPAVRPPSPGCSCTISSLLAYFAITQSGNRSVIEGAVLLTDIYRHWYYSKPVINALKPEIIYVKFHQSIMIIV
jgi:hypothetical protein